MISIRALAMASVFSDLPGELLLQGLEGELQKGFAKLLRAKIISGGGKGYEIGKEVVATEEALEMGSKELGLLVDGIEVSKDDGFILPSL